MKHYPLFFLVFIISFVLLQKNKQNCNMCLYTKCPTMHLSSFCSTIQHLNRDIYLKVVNNMTLNNNDELSKLLLYSGIYGSKMRDCMITNREQCRANFCKSVCNVKKKNIDNDSNFVFDKNQIIDLVQLDINSDIQSLDTKSYQRLSDKDNCVMEHSDFKKIYFDCELSLDREECIIKHYRNVYETCK